METLILGASGATGKKLVEQLIASNNRVKIIVRDQTKLPSSWKNNPLISIIEKNISEVGRVEMMKYLEGCNAVVSCLGHNLSCKGIFGKPRKLVTDAVALVCSSIVNSENVNSMKFILMNTAGNRNRDLNEKVSFMHKVVVAMIRFIIPPHKDNEDAADFLRINIGGHHSKIEWVIVRPDTLLHHDQVSDYTIHLSPTSSAIFKPGKTSRANVAHFMKNLLTDKKLWDNWKGKMPVIYNRPDK